MGQASQQIFSQIIFASGGSGLGSVASEKLRWWLDEAEKHRWWLDEAEKTRSSGGGLMKERSSGGSLMKQRRHNQEAP
ncbi:BnaC01g20020D [Brassica napus]|uniref:BnaC01g20020D protein n=1 Tax=Brassica napus TaxID=3708 RepID=A0A078HPN3_BRANA|nr:BnaC01g20020D [Brassica napus]